MPCRGSTATAGSPFLASSHRGLPGCGSLALAERNMSTLRGWQLRGCFRNWPTLCRQRTGTNSAGGCPPRDYSRMRWLRGQKAPNYRSVVICVRRLGGNCRRSSYLDHPHFGVFWSWRNSDRGDLERRSNRASGSKPRILRELNKTAPCGLQCCRRTGFELGQARNEDHLSSKLRRGGGSFSFELPLVPPQGSTVQISWPPVTKE